MELWPVYNYSHTHLSCVQTFQIQSSIQTSGIFWHQRLTCISFTGTGKAGMREEWIKNPEKFLSFFWSWQPRQRALNKTPLFSWLLEGYVFAEASWNSPEGPMKQILWDLIEETCDCTTQKYLLLPFGAPLPVIHTSRGTQ